MRPTIVYVSGPMTTGGNFPVNIRRGIEVAAAIMDRGYVVICPHEKALGMEMLAPRGYEDWMEYDFRCIDACDVVLRMSDAAGTPLPSCGGDREVEYAKQLGRPVYYSLDTLFAGVPVQQVSAMRGAA
jgi:nucleoside 2-deoxyribosyltransferase